MPKTRIDFWRAKFDRNVVRDDANERALSKAGWRVLTVWECETKRPNDLKVRLQGLFDDAGQRGICRST
jgi:DNA mismatch endonuclease (patch repair protein)